MVVTSSSYHIARRTWWPGRVGGSLYIDVWVSVNTVFYRIIRAVAIWTHSGGNFSILVCVDCRSQEYAIGEMPSPEFMKESESGSGLWPELPHIWWTTLHKNIASNKTSNQTSENQDDNQWPRFLIMDATDQNVPLDLNAFVLKKAIDGMANAELDNVKPMKSSRVFIEVETKQQCKDLLKTTKLLGYLPVKVSPHKTLNSSKFVIKCEELEKMDEEEIKKELQPQWIIAVKRISIRYSLYFLTIKGQTIKKRINIGYLKKETRPYIPNPQRCFQCQKFGHTKNPCKGKAVCAGCGEEGHTLDSCQNEPKCVNCQCDHVAISTDCPKWKIEKDIVTLKYTEKISFADARKRLQPSIHPSKDSYATVTQTPPQSSRPPPPWTKKIRLPIDFRTEIEYLKYILNYCLTRLDTLDEITAAKTSSSRCTFFRWNTPSTTNYSRTKKWNHNPEYWVRSTFCSLKWWCKRNRNAHNEQKKELLMGIVLKRTPTILFQQKRLPLAPQLVSSLAPVCQKGGEEEI